MEELLKQTHIAAAALRRCTDEQRRALLYLMAELVLQYAADILAANALDLAQVPDTDPKKDRLMLNTARLEALSKSICAVGDLPVPDGHVLRDDILPNGIHLRKITVPLGVVGVIYESRPNVTLDISAIGLRSGNAVALRGGSEAWNSNRALVEVVHKALRQSGLPEAVVTLLPTDRALMHDLFNATRYVDVIIPRGSDALIQFVRQHSRVPTIETGAGVCHTYVHEAAHLEHARSIVVNAKVSRPSVCNALDTVLVDSSIAAVFLPLLIPDFEQWQVEVFADERAHAIFEQHSFGRLQQAEPSDFGREFLDYKCSIKVVDGIEMALAHIHQYSSRHSEAIVSENGVICQHFIQEVDAAAVYANASTRFTDGGEFGLGAEIGISTQKLHARGPFALEKLVTEKWIAMGNGQIRT